MKYNANKIGRNEKCLCSSGFKYKHCCYPGSPRKVQRELKLKKIQNSYLKEIPLPVKISNGENPLLFNALNDVLMSRFQRGILNLPNFENAESVAIFSDYGGEAKDSKYLTYTFTFVDYKETGDFKYFMDILRKEYCLDKPFKEISFKDLHYGPIQRSLTHYLNGAQELLTGLVFTLAVDKKIISLYGKNSSEGLSDIRNFVKENHLGEWKKEVLEKSLRIMGVIAYFSRLLIGEGKKIFWMSDHDSIMQDKVKSQHLSKMLSNYINWIDGYKKYDFIGLATPFKEEPSHYFNDILSISDLVAGSIEHYFSKIRNNEEDAIKEKAVDILKWLSKDGIGLKKLNVKMELKEDGSISSGIVDFVPTEPIENVEHIDIVLDLSLEKK